jgi:hypothetical protein
MPGSPFSSQRKFMTGAMLGGWEDAYKPQLLAVPIYLRNSERRSVSLVHSTDIKSSRFGFDDVHNARSQKSVFFFYPPPDKWVGGIY